MISFRLFVFPLNFDIHDSQIYKSAGSLLAKEHMWKRKLCLIIFLLLAAAVTFHIYSTFAR